MFAAGMGRAYPGSDHCGCRDSRVTGDAAGATKDGRKAGSQIERQGGDHDAHRCSGSAGFRSRHVHVHGMENDDTGDIGRDIWDRDIALSDPKDKRTGTVKAEWQIYDKEGSQWLNRSW